MVDYLVIGLGLAGLAFCETLEREGRSFRVIDDGGPAASRVAGGIYNPVVLKRLNKAWKAELQLPLVAPFYSRLDEKLGTSCHHSIPIFRRFSSVEEQNQWVTAADSTALGAFLSAEIHRNKNPSLLAPYGLGEVSGTGRVDTGSLLSAYTGLLKTRGLLIPTRMDFGKLKLQDDSVDYDRVTARNIVFTEGFGLQENPYFNYLPLQGNKGEYLEINCPGLREDRIIKGPVFLIPLGDDNYLAGATYEYRYTDRSPSRKAREYLCHKLDELLTCPYTVCGQSAGIRPTVPDRRALVGRHPVHRNMFVMNGFGSRGVMLAPYAARQLWQVAEEEGTVDPEIDIARYASLRLTGNS